MAFAAIAGITVANPLVALGTVELVPLANEWRFQQTTNLDGVPWTLVNYDDSNWPTGKALLYVESNIQVSPRNTPLTIGRITYYFRTHFSLPFPATNAFATISHRIDDGAVFYLNGSEVQRVRMPAAPTPIAYATRATGTPSSGDAIFPESWTISGLNLTNLVQGDNVLAVEVHQNLTSSDDIVFGCSVTWNFTNAAPVVVSQSTDVSVLDGRSALLFATIDGNPTPALQWFKDGIPIPGATSGLLQFPMANPTNSGNYWLVGSNTFGTVTASNMMLTVLADTNPPIVLTAVAQKNLTNVLITFSEPIRSNTATNPENYALFQRAAPSNQLSVLSLATSGNSAVLLRTPPRIPGLNYTLRVNGIQDTASLSNSIAVDTDVSPSYQIDLIGVDAGTLWKYSQSGAQPATNWSESAYDDSGWSTGAALFHGGSPLPGATEPVRTTLALWNNSVAIQTYYFRTSFDPPGPVTSTSVRLHDIADDGAVFYLNDREAFSIGMPTNRPVTYAQVASRTVAAANYEPSLAVPGAVFPATNLIAGRNLLAAEVHQSASGFSDVAFGVILDAEISEYLPLLRWSAPAVTQEGLGTLTNAATLSLLEPLASDFVVELSSSRPANLSLPGQVTIPAGATNVSFDLTLADNALMEGPWNIELRAEHLGTPGATTTLQVLDNETNSMTLIVASTTSETNGMLAAELRFSGSAVEPITIAVASSDLTELIVPPSVTMPAGATSVVFQVMVVDDQLVDGPQSVTLEGTVTGWPAASAKVTVNDDEARTILVMLPTNVVEGAGTLVAKGRVQLAGNAVSDLLVQLNSSLPELVGVVSGITVAAGQSNAVFDLNVNDTSSYEGSRTLFISAQIPEFLVGSNAVTVLDNDAHHFGFSLIGSPQYSNAPIAVVVTGYTLEGLCQTNLTGTIGLIANGQHGAVQLQTTNIGPFQSGIWTGTVQVLTPDRFVRLQTVDAPGLSEPFHVEPVPWRGIDLLAQDLVFDATRQVIYASVPRSGAAYSNSVVAIDPATAAIIWSLPVAEITTSTGKYWSGKLALSEDGQFLYVVVSDAIAVQRINLNTQTLGPVFAAGTDVFGAAYFVADLVVLAGAPTSVAVARTDAYNAKGVAIFDNGVRRPNTTPEFGVRNINTIEPSADPSILVGYNSQNTGFDLVRIKIDGNGASVLDSTSGILSGFDAGIAYDGGLLFGSFGAVASLTPPTLLGQFKVESSFVCCKYVAPDVAMRRAFFLSKVGTSPHLQAHDLGNFLALKPLDLPSDGGGYRHLIRCGTNGLAFISTAGKVYLVRSSLLTELTTPSDLAVIQSVNVPVLVNSNVTITLTISNRGPEVASEVVLTDKWETGHTFVSAVASRGNWSTNTGKLTWAVGMLAPGSNVTATITLRSATGGWYTNLATVIANELDDNPTNNLSVLDYFIQIDAQPNSVNQLILPANDLAFDPQSGKLFVTVPGRAGPHGNLVQVLDPASAVASQPLFVGNEPGRLALAANDQYLYVAGNSNRSISRISLATQNVTFQFALGSNSWGSPYFVEDMAVLPGQPESLAVSRQISSTTSSGFTHDAVAIYDNGLLRTNVGRDPSHYQLDVIEFGADATRIFAQSLGNVGFNRLAVDAQGVTFLDSDRTLAGGELEFAEGLLYCTSGWVIDPYTRASAGRVAGITNATALLFDAPTRRLFYLQRSGATCQLFAFEAGTFIPLGAVSIQGVTGTPLNLTRWGADGLAFRTTSDQLFVLRTDLVPTNSPADLKLTRGATSLAARVGSDYTYTLSLTNLGPATASDVWLTNRLPAGSAVVGVNVTQGSWFTTAGSVICNLGQLSNGATASISVTLTPLTNGLLSFSAVAVSTALDLTNSNNRVNWLAWSAATNGSAQTVAALGINDIAYDRVSGRIYASVASTNPQLANSLLWINPAIDQCGQPVLLGPNPNRLAISSDGHYLYAGLDEANTVQQFDLFSQTLGTTSPLGGGQKALEIAVCPTNATEVIVYRTYDGRTARYDNGVKAPDELSGMTAFAYSDTSGELYACDGYHSRVPLYRVDSALSGLSLADSQPGHQDSISQLKADGGLLFYSRGMVINPTTKRVLAVMPVPYNSLVEPDVDLGRVFYLTPAGSGWTLRAFDLSQGVEIGAVPILGISGTPTRLVRWGSDGFAICTSAGQLITLQGLLIPVTPATDLALSQAASPSSIGTNDFVTYTLSLTNHGPSLAQGMVVTQAFSLPVTNVTVSPSTGTASWSNSAVWWRPDSLSTGAVAMLTVTARPTQNGTLVALAAARHGANDPIWANNAALTVVNAALPANSNLLQIALASQELVYDAQRDLIYASVPASNQFFGNTVAIISPATGSLLGTFFAGSEPTQLAMAEDGTTLYCALDGTGGAVRLELHTGAVVYDFPLGTDDYYYAQDLEVQPGHPNIVAASLGSFNLASGYPSEVVVYADAQRLPASEGPARGLGFSADGVNLFGYVPSGSGFGFVRMKLGPTGIASRESLQQYSFNTGDLKFSNGRIYTYSGEVLDPFLPLSIGKFGGSGPQAIDSSSGRAFHLTKNGTNWEIRAFDLGTLQNVGTQTVANVLGTPASLIRCGDHRLAFRTSSNQVFILQSPLVATNILSPANLAVGQRVEQDSSTLAETLRYTITVTNQGPAPASNVVLGIAPPVAVESASLKMTQGTSTNTGGKYLCNLGNLPQGQSLQIQLSVVITNTGSYTNFVSVSAPVPDLDFSDNTSTAAISGRFFQRPNTTIAYPAATRGLAYDRTRRRLLAALTPTGANNELAWFDPQDGVLLGKMAIDIAPTSLRVTEDGKYLYLSATGTGMVQRVHLPTMHVDLSFRPGNASTIAAMALIPGSPESVALTYWETNVVTTAIYSNGVAQPDRVNGIQCSLLAASSDGTELYGYAVTGTGGDSPDVFRMHRTGSGLEYFDAGPSDTPWGYSVEMDYFSNRLFFASGAVLNPAGWIEEAGFALPSRGNGFDHIPEAGLAAFLTQDFNYPSAHVSIFTITGRQLLAQVDIQTDTGEFNNLTYCDSDRLAFRTANMIVFLRSSTIPAADLLIMASASTNQVVVGDSLTLQIVVSNAGPYSVSGISLTNTLPAGTTLTSLACSQGTVSTNGDYLITAIGSLATNATSTLTLTLATDNRSLGVRTNRTTVAGNTLLDPIPGNNQANLVFTVMLRDSDSDGLPDDWELVHGLNSTNALDALLDSDCDGISNLHEFQAGSDPLRFEDIRLSHPRMTSPGELTMNIHAAVGKLYSLESSSNLLHWIPLKNFVVSQLDQAIQIRPGRTEPASFYRLRTDTNAALPLLELLNPNALHSDPLLLRISAPPGRSYTVQISTNLFQWSSLTNFFSTACETIAADPMASGVGQRFYRVTQP